MTGWSKPRFRLRRFERLLASLPTGARVLDIGCWNCESLIRYSAMRPDVCFYGVDLIEYGGHPPQVLGRYARVDLESERIPFDSGSFDGIRISHVLEHLADSRPLMSQVRGLLRCGGVLYVSSPNERSLMVPSLNFGHAAGGSFNFYDDPEHRRPLTAHALHCWLRGAGFESEAIETGIERTGWAFFRSLVRAPGAALARDRARLHEDVQTLVGWTTYGAATRFCGDD